MLLQVKLNYITVWLTETSTAVMRAQAGGANVQAFCYLDDVLREGVMRMRPPGAMECGFLQSLRARLSPWAGAVPASSDGLGADGFLCSGAGLSLPAVVLCGFLCAGAVGSTAEPFPAHLDHSHWPHARHMTKHWCNSGHSSSSALGSFTKIPPVWQMYSSTSFWQLLSQLLLLLFRAKPLLVELFPGLYLSFWFISFVFCGKSDCSIQEQWYNYVRALFPFQRGQSENLQGYLFVFWLFLANA